MDLPETVIAVEAGDWPPESALVALCERAIGAAVATLEGSRDLSGAEVSLVFTDDEAIRRLNRAWRGKDTPTNVLSFPLAFAGPAAEGPGEKRENPALQPPVNLLGDVILAAETVAREAALAEKPLEDHMAHLIIHGFLHLLGFDHETDREAEIMEQLERVALSRIGIADPYATP